ncbi:YgfZ/GcvT domain-containing protein [Methylomicrobium agile]|uniref:CAF17-like 4Fe-4S cluster assembly/insertion protein YgfZ n=1 Tax=Methylomicrobium agile TaxID=39774 RepID=UPI0004DF91CC|nr:folate-binding protein YgfZ [Methylomicrobium agile]
MNPQWKTFLLSEQAVIDDADRVVFKESKTGQPRIYPVSHLGILSASGKDAAKLLQGQATCNVFEVTEHQARIGAFCNPKGRAIATFLLAKHADDYLLVLPLAQLEAVGKHLQKYALRADVKLADRSGDFCLLGLSRNEPGAGQLFAARADDGIVRIELAPARTLVIAEPERAIEFWADHRDQHGFAPGNSEDWRLLDLLGGIPWLSPATAEEHVPQMLNLDKLDGISFTKGCYTGQEIVARTHYLGKSKRALFLAECELDQAPEPNAAIVDRDGGEQSRGQVLTALGHNGICHLLAVLLVNESGDYDLVLKDRPDISLRLLPLPNA